MISFESRVASVPMDDPDFNLQVQASGDFNGWRSRAAHKEPWTFEWLKEVGSGTLFDVGACVGSYSLMAAARGATVIAIEPVPVNADACIANAALNNLSDRITVLCCAAGAASGAVQLYASSQAGCGMASGGYRAGLDRVISVQARTLDEIASEHGSPSHIKIDVEGAEREVISGGRPLLDTVQSVICEVTNDYHEAWVLRTMRSHGLESVWSGGRRTEEQRTHIFRRRA